MTEISVTDRLAKQIDIIMETAEKEKAAIANALTTASDARVEPIKDDDEFINLCEVLGHYNRLISLITTC